MFSPGDTVGKYVIEAQLGAGGFGQVFRAREESPRRQVALKFVLPEYAAEPQFLARFAREVDAMAAVEHPNVVPIYERGDADGRPYFAMRFVGGGSLADALRHGWELGDVLDVLDGVAEGLDACHARGVVHRDIKPANILVEPGTRRGLLADFGIALADEFTTLTGPGLQVGTEVYMAPETLSGARATAKSDLWSLGALVYRVLTDALPRGQGQPAETVPVAPSRRAEQLGPDVDRVLLRALAFRPRDRHRDARAFMADLHEAVARPALVTATKPMPRTPRTAVTARVAKNAPAPAIHTRRMVAIGITVFVLTPVLAYALNSIVN